VLGSRDGGCCADHWPRAVLRPNAVGYGNVDAVEANFVQPVVVVGPDGRDGDLGAREVDDQQGERTAPIFERAGTAQGPEVVRTLRVRRPALLAGDDVLVAVTHG